MILPINLLQEPLKGSHLDIASFVQYVTVCSTSNLGRRGDLSVEEQVAILTLSKERMSNRKIPARVQMSLHAVCTVIKRGCVLQVSRRMGGPRKISELLHRLLLRRARTGRYTAR